MICQDYGLSPGDQKVWWTRLDKRGRRTEEQRREHNRERNEENRAQPPAPVLPHYFSMYILIVLPALKINIVTPSSG